MIPRWGQCGDCAAWTCFLMADGSRGKHGKCRRHPPARDGRGEPIPLVPPLTDEEDACWDFLPDRDARRSKR